MSHIITGGHSWGNCAGTMRPTIMNPTRRRPCLHKGGTLIDGRWYCGKHVRRAQIEHQRLHAQPEKPIGGLFSGDAA